MPPTPLKSPLIKNEKVVFRRKLNFDRCCQGFKLGMHQSNCERGSCGLSRCRGCWLLTTWWRHQLLVGTLLPHTKNHVTLNGKVQVAVTWWWCCCWHEGKFVRCGDSRIEHKCSTGLKWVQSAFHPRRSFRLWCGCLEHWQTSLW